MKLLSLYTKPKPIDIAIVTLCILKLFIKKYYKN